MSISVNTPVGIRDVRLYSHHDILTVNEIFCRNDYPADMNLRVVVDIGSNIGISVFFFMTRNNQARCYLFEPDPKNIARLRLQLKSFEDKYELEECAIADFDGQVTFGVENTGRYGGIGIKTEQSITVDCRHINGILRKIIGRKHVIDVVKIDTEGVEIATVKAIDTELLKSIRYIFIEAHPEEDLLPGKINLLCSPCAYPRGKTTGYYGAEKQKRRATLNVKSVLSARQERGEYKFKQHQYGSICQLTNVDLGGA